MKVQPNPHHHPTCKSKVSNVQAACHNCHNKILSALSAWNSRRPIENLAFLFLFLVAARQQLARVRCTLLSVLSTHWDENICFREEKQVCFKMVALAAPGLAIGIKARRTCGLLEMKKLGLQENKCIFKMVGPLLLALAWQLVQREARCTCSLQSLLFHFSPPCFLLPSANLSSPLPGIHPYFIPYFLFWHSQTDQFLFSIQFYKQWFWHFEIFLLHSCQTSRVPVSRIILWGPNDPLWLFSYHILCPTGPMKIATPSCLFQELALASQTLRFGSCPQNQNPGRRLWE